MAEHRTAYVVLRDTRWSDGTTREVLEVRTSYAAALAVADRLTAGRANDSVSYWVDAVPLFEGG